MPIKGRELIRRLRDLGRRGPCSGGKHRFMIHPETGRPVRIPNPHGSDEISDGLLAEVLRQAGISREEWDKSDA